MESALKIHYLLLITFLFIQLTSTAQEGWLQQENGTTAHLREIVFTNADTGWILGKNGMILMTTNGGEVWNSIISNTSTNLNSICFINKNMGWIVGGEISFGLSTFIIMATTDGGKNWIYQLGGRGAYLNSVHFIDQNNGCAVGDSGTILHTTKGGVSFLEEEECSNTPRDYYLSNNFPNPFNPLTKIKYSIPQSSNVVIRVFDVLGKEVETLIHEEKPAGIYEVEFNSHSSEARNLFSGVYFYRFKAGNYIETKKMILLR